MGFLWLACACEENLPVRLATQRKSLRKFNLRPPATTCRSVWPGHKANKKSLIPEESNFRLARDQVVFLETATNLWACPRKANDFFVAFFSIFELGDITKHSITGPAGNSEFCSPRPQGNPRLFSTSIDIEGRGETYNSLFLLGSVIRWLIIIFNTFLR